MLKSEKPVTRYIAAKVLENTLDPIAVEPLLSALKQETTESDPKGTVRSTLIYALGKIGDVRAVPVLLNILTGPEKELHSCAASNLMSFENPGTVDIWTAQLRNPKVRYDAAIMLGKAKDPKAVAPLLQILRDCTPIHKRQVVWALGNIGSPKAVEPLFELLKDDTQADYVLGETARALQKIGDPRLVPFLTKNLTREKLADRSARILIGTGWKPTTMEERIHFAVIDRNGFYLRNYWDETKKVLLNDVVSKQGHAIRFAVNAFVGIGNEEIIPNLQEILEKNGDKEMAEAYLNCGHAELRTCAQTWAAKHGYRIIGGKGSNVRWKSF
jgi:HEAT repeat protein